MVLSSPADGGDGGEVSQAHGAFDHVVVGVAVDIAQVTKAEQQVHDEHEDDDVVGVGGGVGQMAKALAQFVFEAEEGEQVLEEDEAGEGGEGLGVELEDERTGGFSLHFASGKFHGGGFLLDCQCFAQRHDTPTEKPPLYFLENGRSDTRSSIG